MIARVTSVFLTVLLLALLLTGAASAQQEAENETEDPDVPADRMRWFLGQRAWPDDTIKQGYLLRAYEAARQIRIEKEASSPFGISGLNWNPAGPAPTGLYSGRIPAVAVHPTDANVVFIGAANGGVWRTSNGGTAWTALSGDEPSLASGSLVIDPVNPDVIYYGTGEPYSSIDSYGGVGVRKSTDGGSSWFGGGLSNEKRITRIAINPQNTSTLLAATWGGIYRTTNAGASWTKTSSFSGGWEVIIDPADTNVCYAAASGLYKSTNGGTSWTKLAGGAPSSTGRVAMAVVPGNHSTVFALVSNNTLFKSTDAGATWSPVTIPSDLLGSQGWYDITVAVSPTNQNVILLGGVYLYRSADGGATWGAKITGGNHVDHHQIVFGPAGSGLVYMGHDGGISKSFDEGATWGYATGNLAITQFYSLGTDEQTPAYLWGGTQDNGTQKGTGTLNWTVKLGGDGGFVVVDPSNSNTVYAEAQYGQHFRSTNGSSFSAIQNGITGNGAWVTPVVINPDTPSVLYTATSKIYRTTDRGDAWTVTAGSYPWSGTITQLAVPKTATHTLYASTAGTLFRSDDAGATWVNVSSGLPSRTITCILPHPTVPDRLFLTVSGSGSAHLFRSNDAGGSWTSISGNYPTDLPANSIAINPSNDANLFAGTDLGIWSSDDGGVNWAKDDNFPNTAVAMLGVTSDSRLVASTHGRGMFTAAFSTSPSVTVASPNGAESWPAGTLHTINWSSNAVSSVNLAYSTNNGAAWLALAAGVAASAGSYDWAVPNTPSTQCLVRVSDASNAALNDASNAPFTILPPRSITVTSPNGGETWAVGSMHNVTWTSVSVSFLRIDYSTNAGAAWSTIANTIPANQGSWSWTLPNTPTSAALVRVSESADPALNDVSNAVFTIGSTPSIAVVSPNGGESWYAGSQHAISWTSALVTNVKIEYSTNAGGAWSTIVPSTSAAPGSYAWTLPAATTAQALVRVSDASNSATADQSNSVFAIAAPPQIALTAPNGGEGWTVGTAHPVTWTSTGSANLRIDYSTNAGSSWSAIVGSTAAATGSYSWTIPNTPTTQALVKISDAAAPAYADTSNAVFTIVAAPSVAVTSPNGAESWNVGSLHPVTWTSTLVSTVNIAWSTDNGASWSAVAGPVAASGGSYSWTVPNTPTAQGRVRVSDASNAAVTDQSNAAFSIVVPPGITVTSPNGGEVWSASASKTITWTASGISNVRIRYSTNDGASWSTIASNTPASAGSYPWTVPADPTNLARVLVTTPSGSYSDMSDAPFTISVGATISLLAPDGGETWTIGSVRSILWSSLGVADVRIDYSTNGGGSWMPVTASAPDASREYSWTIPPAPTGQARVRIASVADSTITDITDANFSIEPPPVITLTSPNGGELFLTGSPATVGWTSSGIGSVKIEYSVDGGSGWTTVDPGYPAESGMYPWVVPLPPTDEGVVRVSDASDAAIFDMSDSPFMITAHQFLASLVIGQGGQPLDTLRFGAAAHATDGLDSAFGEADAGALPGPSVFDARWRLPAGATTTIDIRDTLASGDSTASYVAALQAGSGGYPLSLAWDGLGRGIWTLVDDSTKGSLFSMAMPSPGQAVLSDPAVRAVRIVHARGTTVERSPADGWNLVSVPVTVVDPQKTTVFPGAVSPAYAYDAGYQAVETLAIGEGYWVKYASPAELSITGTDLPVDTIPLRSGWNLVGSVSRPVAVASVNTIPPGTTLSGFFGYSGGYVSADSIRPLEGYWVKSSADALLLLGSGGPNAATTESRDDPFATFNSLTIGTTPDRGSTLYFRRGGLSGIAPESYLPPPPPRGVFDARFATGRFAEGMADPPQALLLRISGVPGPVGRIFLSWNIRDGGSYELALRDGEGRRTQSVVALRGTGASTLDGGSISGADLSASGGGGEPAEMTLLQNYPNPFNPSTVIRYRVPVTAHVRLSVHGVLGSAAAILVDRVEGAGEKSVVWDASAEAEGVYFCRLEVYDPATGEVSSRSRKMLLLK